MVAIVGCSVRTQSEPQSIPHDDIPFGLTDDDRPDGPNSAPAGVETVVYLIGSDALVAAPRRASLPVTAVEVLRILVEGPTDAEIAAGIRTDLPADTAVLRVGRRDSIALVDLGGGVEALRTQGGINAFAQMVYTVTELPQFDRVAFRLDGRRIEVPTGDGGLTSAPVSRDDYPPG
jgi:spore germination protein GerM